jgi:HAD domain in Swiss Army Knife RNA repair proteins
LRIVFLDFDGVLNARAFVGASTTPGPALLDAVAVARVEQLCATTGAAVVVSSSWRATFPLPELAAMLRAKGLARTPVVDVTPVVVNKRGRGEEIQRWLDAAPRAGGFSVDGLVILDDEPDMLHLAPWLVQTSFETGVTAEHLEAARAVLARPPP